MFGKGIAQQMRSNQEKGRREGQIDENDDDEGSLKLRLASLAWIDEILGLLECKEGERERVVERRELRCSREREMKWNDLRVGLYSLVKF